MRSILSDSSLISQVEAIDKLSSILGSLKETEIELSSSLGKISSRDVFSPIDLPSFSRSTVDGYAVKSLCTPGKFSLKGKVNIGESPQMKVESCEDVVEVDTGSVIPEGADAVVKIEDTRSEDGKIIIPSKVDFGSNVGWIGSDLPSGIKVLRSDSLITPEIIGLLSALGLTKVHVYSTPKAFIVSTGNELVSPGEIIEEGKVYESNLYYLKSALIEDGMEVIGTRTVRDDYDAIKDAILKGVKTADLVVTTGGTSAGERDYVYRVVKEMGEMIFHGIRFKPGKPTFVGRINDIPIIGLPGNMVSTIMVYRKIVRPSLERKFKIKARERITVKAKSLLEIKADKKRFTYIPVLLFRKSSEYYALPLKFDSYMIGTFSMANGYIGLSEGSFVNEEDEVTVEVTNPPGDTTIVGEEDPAVPSTGIYYPLGSLPALKMLEKKVGDVLVLSSLVKVPDDFDLEIKREILSNGQGAEIGYDEWVSLSKYVKNPSVKLRYRSLIKRFIGKAKVIGPSSYVQSGNEVGTESLFVIAVTEMGKQLIKSFKVNKST
ncbi:molybdopterin-binding protein [Sulfuracidifex tepidarius]|uniref:MoaB/Mog domain-containing protein n=1 Tax=Sulfuracidifex tepidarius TaxID=1294262 RepID=A0A510E6Y9_9CREN|nr:molybdopterin-binding protein [Sulfuracidifex tepidarius]BBG28207.1 hypothetical protein IC007_2763 [Sulfuracidifex tepidarius]